MGASEYPCAVRECPKTRKVKRGQSQSHRCADLHCDAGLRLLRRVSHGNLMMFFSMEGILMVGVGSISVTFMRHADGEDSPDPRVREAVPVPQGSSRLL